MSFAQLSTPKNLIKLLNRPAHMRYRDRAADDERDVESIHEFFAGDAAIRTLLEVISNAIVAAQDNRGREPHQLLRFLVERTGFVSLRVERKESFDAQMATAEQLLDCPALRRLRYLSP